MIQSKFCSVTLLIAVIGAVGPAYPQQQPTQSSASSSASATPAPSQGPTINTPTAVVTPDMLKRANAVGMHPEARKGVTVYCWEDADIGTHFTTKKCVDENRLDEMIRRLEAQKQQKLQAH